MSFDFDPVREEYATAIGHVVISFNMLEVSLFALAGRLWPDQTASEIARLFGQRSMDERLTMCAKQLDVISGLSDWCDRVDRSLRDIRHLTGMRNRVIHQKLLFGVEKVIGHELLNQTDMMEPDDIMAISDQIDDVVVRLDILVSA